MRVHQWVWFLFVLGGFGLAACGGSTSTETCDPACDADACQVCVAGVCQSSCRDDDVCDGAGNCVDPGTCDPACDADACETCVDGSCESNCTGNEVCDGAGNCVDPGVCDPACNASACEHCVAGSCQSYCTGDEQCDGAGNCVDPGVCDPACSPMDCETCVEGNCESTCTGSQVCDGAGNCVQGCTPTELRCAGDMLQLCSMDGLWQNEQDCTELGQYCEGGACVNTCDPWTCTDMGWECGIWDDHCGDQIDCGNCGSSEDCVDGLCVCTPQCQGKECGADGCGGQCGICTGTQVCDAGHCEEPCTDADSDGYAGTGAGCDPSDPNYDCDDTLGSVHPGATEICGNGRDDDCQDGDLPCCTSHDHKECLEDGDVYWFNSCGAREDRYMDCGSLGCLANCSQGDPGCIQSWTAPECRDGDVWVGAYGDLSCTTSGFLSSTVSGPRQVHDCHGMGCDSSDFTCGCSADCGTHECGSDGCGGSCGTCGTGRTCVDGTCLLENPCGTCPAHSHCDSASGVCICESGYVPDPSFTTCIALGGSCGAVGSNGFCVSDDLWVWCDVDASGSGVLRSMSCGGAVGSYCHTFASEGFGMCDCGDFGDGTLCTDLGIGSAYEYRLFCVGGGYNVLTVDNCQGVTGRSGGFCSTYVSEFGYESACFCEACEPFFSGVGCSELCSSCSYNASGNFHTCW